MLSERQWRRKFLAHLPPGVYNKKKREGRIDLGLEFELKYSASPESQNAIARAVGEGYRTLQMETTYYDTPGGDLARRHYTLRRRLENGVSVCTVKTPAGEKGRGEWETRCDTIEEAIEPLCLLGAPKNLLLLTAGGVAPICGARFTRRCCTIAWGDCTLELALDQGVLTGGGREISLCEVEVELKSGSREDVIRFGENLAGTYGLIRQQKSKFRRALELYQEDAP